MDPETDRPQPRHGVTLGLVLIAVGAIVLGGRLGWGPAWQMHTLWPLILIAFGIARIASPRDESRRSGGYWILLTGVLFLLNQLHIVRVDQTWPLYVVGGGLAILFGRGRRPRGRPGRY